MEPQHAVGNKTASLMAHLVDCNNNYIGIGIYITKNIRRYNVMLITIHLFGNNTIIEP